MSFIYYTYVFLVWSPKLSSKKPNNALVNPSLVLENFLANYVLIVFNALFAMMGWSFIQAMITDPGQVPVFWVRNAFLSLDYSDCEVQGFHQGDSSSMKRRYCLMCNIFKPERCHHCSSCNRCVLNMDHHCPWINNCVGFWNRKYFLLLLIYALVLSYFVFLTLLYDFFGGLKYVSYACVNLFSQQMDAFYFSSTSRSFEKLSRVLCIQLTVMFSVIIGGLMTCFLRFHIGLIQSNKTTIENLEQQAKVDFKSIYNMGGVANWQQVFGPNKYLWAFPVFLDSGKPMYDGINWPTSLNQIGLAYDKQVIEEDEDGVTELEKSQTENIGQDEEIKNIRTLKKEVSRSPNQSTMTSYQNTKASVRISGSFQQGLLYSPSSSSFQSNVHRRPERVSSHTAQNATSSNQYSSPPRHPQNNSLIQPQYSSQEYYDSQKLSANQHKPFQSMSPLAQKTQTGLQPKPINKVASSLTRRSQNPEAETEIARRMPSPKGTIISQELVNKIPNSKGSKTLSQRPANKSKKQPNIKGI